MSSIAYDGHSFEPYVSAELVEPVAHVINPETANVPGRPGLVLLSADVEPLELKVRLFMDAPDALTTAQRSEVRRTLRSWLLSTEGATLEVPGEPGLEWHDVVCSGVSDWSSLFSEGSATVTFLARPHRLRGRAVERGRDARGGRHLADVAGRGGGRRCRRGPRGGLREVFVRMSHAFSEGDKVVIDMAAQAVTVNDGDATADVTLGSDFFALAPGRADLLFASCSSHVVRWRERWA